MNRIVLVVALLLAGSVEAANYPFYAFQNGVRKSTDEKRADLVKRIGFDGIGSASLPADGDLEKLFATYRERELKVFSFYTGATVTDNGGTVPPRLLELIPAMKGSGVVIEFFVKGNKSLPQEEAVKIVRQVADLASKAGITVVLYPHTNMYVETLDEAVSLAKAVDRENVGVMFNLCHFLRVEPETDLRATLKEAGPLLRQVSISGADKGGKDWSALIQPLGQGSYEVEEVLKLLSDIGFDGPVGLQCFNIKGDSETFLEASMQAWREMR